MFNALGLFNYIYLPTVIRPHFKVEDEFIVLAFQHYYQLILRDFIQSLSWSMWRKIHRKQYRFAYGWDITIIRLITNVEPKFDCSFACGNLVLRPQQVHSPKSCAPCIMYHHLFYLAASLIMANVISPSLSIHSSSCYPTAIFLSLSDVWNPVAPSSKPLLSFLQHPWTILALQKMYAY